MKSALPLIALLVFFILLAIVILFITAPKDIRGGQMEPTGFLCSSGDVRPCVSGNCEGTSTCIQGVWTGCNWERICTPGRQEPCIAQGCAYAVKECNECGTGWGECSAISQPAENASGCSG